jgi:hypothetical protein
MTGDTLITVASWEERSPAGVERSLGAGAISTVVCVASTRYKEETRAARDRIARACEHAGVAHEPYIFDFEDQVVTFRKVTAIAEKLASSRVIFDISTAPRSIIWTLLGVLKSTLDSVTIRYSRALEYAAWQTSEEGEPKLIINRSGIMFPDLPTCLVILCGPEISRAEKLCYQFEPKTALILRDTDASDFGDVKNLSRDYAEIAQEINFDNKDLTTPNMEVLHSVIAPFIGTHNIVAASLGPKLGSLVLFQLLERHEDIALSYVTSGKHNLNSTKGIGIQSDVELIFAKA